MRPMRSCAARRGADPQRHLTKMYTETKRSYDTITEPPKVDVTPEMSTLHRKLRIQKDRLITWGLEWSDTTAAQPGDIDESIEREGLTNVVSNVMSSIKEILEEAEKMRSSDKTNVEKSTYDRDTKLGKAALEPWTPADKPRFQDLLNDLTTSIDTLFNLSRSRRRTAQAPIEKRALKGRPDDLTAPDVPYVLPAIRSTLAFGAASPAKPQTPTSSRVDSVLRIDPSALVFSDDTIHESLPPYETVATPSNSRTMGHLRRPQAAAHPWNKDGRPTLTIPVLIEYAPFDPIYSSTGISPSISRLESLAEALHDTEESPILPDTRVLNLLGYFECPQHPRFGLVYGLPDTVYSGPADAEKSLESMAPFTLLSLLQSSNASGNSLVPNLEDRIRLACSLAKTFLHLHAKAVTHRDVTSNNVVFFRTTYTTMTAAGQDFDCDLRSPYLASFDLFSEFDVDERSENRPARIYRHLRDTRGNPDGAPTPYKPAFDIYGLGMILLEIGLWMPLSSFYKRNYDLRTFQNRIQNIYVKKLGQKCGSAYMRAVESCLSSADHESSLASKGLTPNVQWRLYCDVVKRLERCCAIEDDETEVPSLDKSLPALPVEGEVADVPAESTHPTAQQSEEKLATPKDLSAEDGSTPGSSASSIHESADVPSVATEEPVEIVSPPPISRRQASISARIAALSATQVSRYMGKSTNVVYFTGKNSQTPFHERARTARPSLPPLPPPLLPRHSLPRRSYEHPSLEPSNDLTPTEHFAALSARPASEHSIAPEGSVMGATQSLVAKDARLVAGHATAMPASASSTESESGTSTVVDQGKSGSRRHAMQMQMEEDPLFVHREYDAAFASTAFSDTFISADSDHSEKKTEIAQPLLEPEKLKGFAARHVAGASATQIFGKSKLEHVTDEPAARRQSDAEALLASLRMRESDTALDAPGESAQISSRRKARMAASPSPPLPLHEHSSIERLKALPATELRGTPEGKSRSPQPKAKLLVVPVRLARPQLEEWHETLLPRVERLVEKALSSSMETFTIDLIGVVEAGSTPETSRATILVTCTSVGKVKGVLHRHFRYDQTTFSLKVRKGKLRRSCERRTKSRPGSSPRRSAMHSDDDGDDESESDDFPPVMNPYHQDRPLCGASIGAYNSETRKHHAAVSYGGVVMVDGKPFGMTVHHLLDDSSEEEDSDNDDDDDDKPTSPSRSSGGWKAAVVRHREPEWSAPQLTWQVEAEDEAYISEFSEEEVEEAGEYDWSLYEASDDEEDEEYIADHHGDVPGIRIGQGSDLIVTQPAIDDVAEGFFPSASDKDREHLDCHTLGRVYASSGIRRWKRDDKMHEIDWALLDIDEDRLQPHNVIQGGKKYCGPSASTYRPELVEPICRHRDYLARDDLYPSSIARMEDLPGLRVHSVGRTSGLRGGVISSAMSSVRVAGRKTPSRSFHVLGTFGVAGDSGAWVIDNDKGRVCGHVLAWCSRNRWAYICPMEILLEDMKRTLPAESIELPGASHDSTMDAQVARLDCKAADVDLIEPRLLPADMEHVVKGMQVLEVGSSSDEPELAERSGNLHGAAVLIREENPGFGRKKRMVMEGRRVRGQMAKG